MQATLDIAYGGAKLGSRGSGVGTRDFFVLADVHPLFIAPVKTVTVVQDRTLAVYSSKK